MTYCFGIRCLGEVCRSAKCNAAISQVDSCLPQVNSFLPLHLFLHCVLCHAAEGGFIIHRFHSASPFVLHLSHGFQCSPILNRQPYEGRLPLTSWWRKLSNITVGISETWTVFAQNRDTAVPVEGYNIWLHRVLWTVRPPSAIHAAATDRGKLMTLVAGNWQSLLMAGDDDEMFMTRSLNVTPKTTEQHLIARSEW